MIPICPPPATYSFTAITPYQIREMNIGHWVNDGLTLEEAEEFEDITDGGDFGSDRYNELIDKMVVFCRARDKEEEEKKKDNFIYKILSSFWK